MTTEKRVDVAPLLRWGGAQRERFRFDAAGFTQGDNEVPAAIPAYDLRALYDHGSG